MREDWERRRPALAPDPAWVAAIVADAVPGAAVRHVAAVPGGLSNTGLKAVLDAPAGPGAVLVRLWQCDPADARKEVALLRRLAELLPVPRVRRFDPADPAMGVPCGVLDWIEGERLDRAAPRLSGAELATLGRAVGRALAAAHGVRFAHTGFLDPMLAPGPPLDFGGAGLVAWVRECLDGRAGPRLGAALSAELLRFAEAQGGRLDVDWARQPCLSHGDFNGSNILVHAEGDAGWGVAGVLDWEFALAGGPAFDFGNLLRPPLGEIEGFAEAVASGYAGAGRTLPPDWRRVARIADLFAWVDFLARPEAGGALVRDAREMARWSLDGARAAR